MMPLFRAVACDCEDFSILDRDILVRALDLDEAMTNLACQLARAGGRPTCDGNTVRCGAVCYLVVKSRTLEGL